MPRNRFQPTHGMKGTPTYASWEAMKTRCTNPRSSSFGDYGARGVRVCDRWRESFAAFLSDMGERPVGKTLDRWPDRRGHYEPGNCRWATKTEQQRNTTANVVLEREGVSLTLGEWAARQGIAQTTLSYRLRHGWTAEEALSLRPRLGLKRSPPARTTTGRFASKFGAEVELP